MALTADTARAIKQEIQNLEEALDALNTEITAAVSQPQSYKLDTNEGSQSKTNRSLNELLKAKSHLEAALRWNYSRLNGTGLTNVTVRRKQGYRLRY